MNDMLQFNLALLQGIASFLGSTPIIYLVGFGCGLFVIRMIKTII